MGKSSLSLTGVACIYKVITDLALLEIKAKTAGNLVISNKVKTMSFGLLY
ncbi:Succinyl-CoA:3-ketoacid-coenzyme A transferase subunit B (fragment) [Pseudoalteromonas sp. 3J6]